MARRGGELLCIMSAAAFLCSVTVLTGCSSSADQTQRGTGSPSAESSGPFSAEATPYYEPNKVNSIVVYPLVSGATTRVSEEVLSDLTAMLTQALQLDTSLGVNDIVTTEKIESAVKEVSQEQMPPMNRAVSYARVLGAQAVIFGVVNKYDMNVGRDMDDLSKAHVNFRLWLVDADSGHVLWMASYDNYNLPLTQNLLRVGNALSQGVRYKSSRELAEAGFAKAAKAIDDLRERARIKQE